MKRTTFVLVSLLVLTGLLFAACGAAPTATPLPPTATPVPPTAVPVPPTATKAPAPTNTTAPAAATAVPATAVPPTATAVAPTATKAPAGPTNTPAPTPTPVPGQAGVITVWHNYTGDYTKPFEAAVADYIKANPNVKMQFAQVSNLTDALKVAVPSKKGPDVIAWANDIIGANALAGNIVDLSKYGIDKAYLTSNFEPAAVAGVTWRNLIWGLPTSQEGIAFVYNKDLVADKYLPKSPLDFADLLAKATAFNTDNPGKFLVCNQGLGNADPYHAAPIWFGLGMPTYVDDQGKVYFNTPEALKAAQWLVQFSKVAPKETSHEICKANLVDKKVGAWWTGPWAIADLEKAGIKYGILPLGKPFVGIQAMMLSANAVDRGNADASVAFMKWYTSADTQKKITLANKTIPANTKVLKDPEVQALGTIPLFGAALNLGIPMSNSPFADAQWGPVGDGTTAIWTGKQAPDAGIKSIQDTMEAKIKDMK